MSVYYNYKKTLSYQAMLNLIIGERGVGKTYGFLKEFTNQFIKHGHQFIYLRRYNSELDQINKKLFDYHIENDEFPEHGITYKNRIYSLDGQPFCYMIPLTREGHIKSVPMSKIKYILFDEFTITNRSQRYIKNEPEQLLSFAQSVFRKRDPKIFCIGNASSVTNPYFDYFKVKLPYKSEYKTYNNGLILVNYIKNEAYRKQVSQSKFGQLIKNTRYGSYAIDNEFIHDDHNFIAKKPAKAWLFACLYIEQNNYGLWIDSNTGYMYISKAFDPNNPRAFAITSADHTENVMLASVRTSPWLKKMIECYKLNMLYFENINIKNYVMNVIKKFI